MAKKWIVKEALGLLGWLVLTFAAAAVGAVASASSGGIHGQLARPAWAPPAWVFGPAWSVLYLLMGVAVWLVWRERGFRGAVTALGLNALQLAANAFWTWLFFVWRLGALAFAEILVLWVLVLATAFAFWRVRALAGALLIPYLLWVTFASALAFVVWRMNPSLLG